MTQDSWNQHGIKQVGLSRKYDHAPLLREGITRLEDFPADVQEMVGEGMIRWLKTQGFSLYDGELKQLGSENVMNLFKSKAKRRWYDKVPSLHKAFRYFYHLDSVACHFAGFRMLLVAKALQQGGIGSEKAFASLIERIFMTENADLSVGMLPDVYHAKRPADLPGVNPGRQPVKDSGDGSHARLLRRALRVEMNNEQGGRLQNFRQQP